MDQVVTRPEGPALAAPNPAGRRLPQHPHRERIARRRAGTCRSAGPRRREPEGLPADLLLALLA